MFNQKYVLIITAQLITHNNEFTETSIHFDLNHAHSGSTLSNTRQV